MKVRAAQTPWLLLALAVLNLAMAGGVAAAEAKLTGGTVTPTTGTTATAFQFSVHFVGTATDTAVSVSASVAGRTVLLSLTGSPRIGTWTGSSTLPAGSWTVTYHSTTTGSTNPSFPVPGQVVVTAPTAAPTASPRPTPKATPRPTSVPATAVPGTATSASPGSSPTPFGSTASDASGVPSDSQTAPSSRDPNASPSLSPSPGALPPGSRPFSVPVEGVVAIGLLGAVTFAAALRERRRRLAVEAFRAAEATPGEAAPPTGEDLDDGWEGDIVEDETVATIDYKAPDEPSDPPNG
jgi:hypothetical protein